MIAFVLALIGGLIVLVTSVINAVWFSYGATSFGGYGSYMRGVMDGYHSFMGSNASSTGFFASLSIIGVVCGVIVVMSAILLQVNPRQHVIWAVVIIAFFSDKFRGHGRFLHRRHLGHLRWSIRLKLKTNQPMTPAQLARANN